MSVRLSVCPSIRMEQLGSYCMDFHEIWFFNIYGKIRPEKWSATEIWHSMQRHTNLHLSQFLEWEIFQRNVVEKINTHVVCSINFSHKSCRLWDNVKKYGTTRQATDNNIIRHMLFACWINKATNAQSEYLIRLLFYSNIYHTASQYYAYSTFSAWFIQ